jgi:dienelactone hydrolase
MLKAIKNFVRQRSRHAQQITPHLGVGTAQAGSLIAFPNVNENAQPSLLPGYLAKPDGSGPFPAVVILHGCGGFFSSYASVADDLQWEGYVALAVDSLGPRGNSRCLCRRVNRTGNRRVRGARLSVKAKFRRF